MKTLFLLLSLWTCLEVSGSSMLPNYSSCNNVMPYQKQKASYIFRNKSDYSMVIKIMHQYGGLFETVYLPAHSNQTVLFGYSAVYKLKIKATRNGQSSFHNGGSFAVTCTDTEWTEGEMSFQMSTYGSGLGPTISESEFEKNN